ncbi:hypothetical protein [Winogradskyella haliclonae]|uniref:YhhN-like protein n=1 Tax=Winogradskyella haliclonae TaxID=2048558 RepID=A0ABQ2C2H2_9FLAO|nr:hypothetical protein [Winogradskyella haliclonae]GGI58411.1 hypothetical protein GCM10011444_27200 [Winogradskyella haliclonae]
MIINRLLKVALVILSVAFIILEVLKVDLYNDWASALLLLLLTYLYRRSIDLKTKKRPYFLYFLIAFTISEILSLSSNYILLVTETVNYDYYLGNFFYMLAYVFLILRCMLTMKFKAIVKQFPVTLIILAVLGVFCVTLITETAQTKLETPEYITEFLYNIIVMTLLSVALISYMDKGDNKSMLFLIGSMFIFFSEMIQLAYYYVADMTHLAAIYSVFLVLAFVFYYLQSSLKHQRQTDFNFLDSKMEV